MDSDKKWQEAFIRKQQFLKSVNLCTLCNSPLILIHEVNKAEGEIEEEAQCEKCKITTRRKKYNLQ